MDFTSFELSEEVKKELEEQNQFLFDRMQKLKKENIKLHRLVHSHKWGHRVMESDPKMAEYLTGCASYEVFKWLLKFVALHVDSQSLHSLADQLMLTLMKVKLDLPDVFLGKLFRNACPKRVFDAWFNGLITVSLKLVVWPDEEKDEAGRYIVNTVKINPQLSFVVVLTYSGGICFVSEIISNDSPLESCGALDKMNIGDKVYDNSNAVCCIVIYDEKENKRKLSSTIRQDFSAMTKARKSVKNVMEKVTTFAIFSKGVGDINFANSVIRISASLANFYSN